MITACATGKAVCQCFGGLTLASTRIELEPSTGKENNLASEPLSVPPEQTPARRRRLAPPIGIWIWLAILIGINVWARLPDGLDSGLANILALASMFLGLMTIVLWLAFFSGYSPTSRHAPLVAVVVGITLMTALFRIESVGGDLSSPRLQWRWSPHADELLAQRASATAAKGVDLNKTTDDDFPQFLGPAQRFDRSCRAGPRLDEAPSAALEATDRSRSFRIRGGEWLRRNA